MTNKDKYAAALAEIYATEDSLLAAFMSGRVAPVALFSNAGNAGVTEWAVEGVKYARSSWPREKPTSKEVAIIMQNKEAALALQAALPMKVMIYIKDGNTSSAVPWPRLEDRSYGQYPTREEAEAANKKWHEDHDARPGHFACRYCGKQTPEAQKVRATIFVNHGRQEREFCSSQCATHDQFASEG